MNAKFAVVAVLLFGLCLLHFKSCTAAPRPTNEELLEKSIANLLRHDKGLVKDLQQLGFAYKPELDRVKRQSEFDDSTNDAGVGGDDQRPKEPGFFDRAAKFVVELLQRFLRWINTDGS